jgi:hypothetical protein
MTDEEKRQRKLVYQRRYRESQKGKDRYKQYRERRIASKRRSYAKNKLDLEWKARHQAHCRKATRKYRLANLEKCRTASNRSNSAKYHRMKSDSEWMDKTRAIKLKSWHRCRERQKQRSLEMWMRLARLEVGANDAAK